MSNAKLVSLACENFASFAEEIFFTTIIDPSKKESSETYFTANNSNLNTINFVYGANGAGKTFFCKIIREIQRLLLWSPLAVSGDQQFLLSLPQLKGLDDAVKTFAFDKANATKPTRFSIEIILEEINYNYSFSILDKCVIQEQLTKKKIRTETLLFRESSSYKDITLKSDFKSFESAKHLVKEQSLCLPIISMLNNELASKIIQAIKNIQVFNMATATMGLIDPKQSFSDERLKKYIKVLKVADPTLRNLTVSLEDEEVTRQKLDVDIDNFENREFIATKTTVGIKTTHAVFENGTEVLSEDVISFFGEESLGTVKLFTSLPYLYDVLETGGTLVIDEIENGLHLSLIKEILSLFLNKRTNPFNAQLLCTSHQPLLLDGDTRRDQVWIISKDAYGKSSLQRLSNLKTTRKNVNLTNKLLEGAFGCNPAPFFDIST